MLCATVSLKINPCCRTTPTWARIESSVSQRKFLSAMPQPIAERPIPHHERGGEHDQVPRPHAGAQNDHARRVEQDRRRDGAEEPQERAEDGGGPEPATAGGGVFGQLSLDSRLVEQ